MSDLVTRQRLLEAMARHIGRESGATAHVLVVEICGQWSAGAERELRKRVEELRTDGMPICAHPGTGYYVANTADELEASIRFLTERLRTTARQLLQLRRMARPVLAGQKRLQL